jgi:glycosyltransferase involved in cell wall biosynthesis
MRILWIPDLPWAAMEGQRQWHFINRLLRRGHEIEVLTWEEIGSARGLVRTLGSRTERDGSLTIHRARRLPNPMGRITGDYSRGFRPNEWLFRQQIRGILGERRFDLMVYGLSNQAVGLPPFDVSVPRVFDYLDLCPYPSVEDEYLRNSDLVFCTSTVLVDRVRARGGRAVYVPNGVDRLRIAAGKPEAVRQRLDLVGKKVVSLIGLTFSRTLFFVDAIAEAARQVPDLVFLAVGGSGWLPGRDIGGLEARCRELGVRLVTTGRVPNAVIGDYFMASDVGLYPGDANPYFDAACPIKVLEYSAAGKPVVATDLAELRRFSWPNLYLAPAEPRAFAAGIVRALRERTGMPDLAAFEWDVLAQRFEESCDALIAQLRPRPGRGSTSAAAGGSPLRLTPPLVGDNGVWDGHATADHR